MIVSIPRRNATHVASDSRAAVDNAMSIIDGTSNLRKPWMLQVDGDLWYIFASALEAKGYHSCRASWVKGRVTMQAMRDDPDSIPDAIDNGVADLIAGAGATTAGTTAQSQLLGYYSQKQRAYSRLIRAIIDRILRVSDEVRARREAVARQRASGQRGAQFIDAPNLPIHPTPDVGFRIKLASLLHLVESSMLLVGNCSL